MPEGEVDQEENDANNEEYQHGRCQPLNLGIVLGRQVVFATFYPPELHCLEWCLNFSLLRICILISIKIFDSDQVFIEIKIHILTYSSHPDPDGLPYIPSMKTTTRAR